MAGISNLYGKFVRRIVYPLSESLRGFDTAARLQEFERSQYWLPQEMADFQFRRLQRVVRHAYEHVPFYRESFCRAGIRPEQIRSFEDFRKIPMLDKDEVRANPHHFVADSAGRLVEKRTGGSTGTPMLYFAGPDCIASSKAAVLRAWRWWEVEMGEPRVQFWGHNVSFAPGWRGHWAKLTRPVRNRLYNYKILSAYDMSPERMHGHWQCIERVRPSLILGYASTLHVFAQFLDARGYDAHQLGVKVIVATSEQLYHWQRQLIERVFGCPVANEYGATEIGIIAYECPSHSLHLADERIYVEILPLGQTRDDGLGEIVVTQLANWGAPLIRYRTGDLAKGVSLGCSCGRALRVLDSLSGRTEDMFVSPDGRYVHGLFFIHIMEYVTGVRRFQVVQESLHHTRVRIVPESDPPIDEAYVRKRIQQHLGETVAVSFEYTDEIPLERSGKYRWVVSKLHLSCARMDDPIAER